MYIICFVVDTFSNTSVVKLAHLGIIGQQIYLIVRGKPITISAFLFYQQSAVCFLLVVWYVIRGEGQN